VLLDSLLPPDAQGSAPPPALLAAPTHMGSPALVYWREEHRAQKGREIGRKSTRPAGTGCLILIPSLINKSGNWISSAHRPWALKNRYEMER
jgi:hypothetical protein